MNCPDCGSELLPFPVPEHLREHVDGSDAAGVCTNCLHVVPTDDAPAELPDFATVSEAFPENREAAATMAVLVELCSSLALHRSEIADLVERVERAGVDPFLVLDRLAADPALDPHVDIAGRRRQLLQLLD